MAIVAVTDLKPQDRHKVIEVKVYRQWIDKNPPYSTPTGFCCILIDKWGNAIQANMNFKDMEYFNKVMEVQSAYRISDFNCENTKSWHQTLPNPTSLKFGRFTKFEQIPNNDFPNHHFNFVSYNQLPSRLAKNSLLIDYIGCVRNVGELIEFGNPNRDQSFRRSLTIENLNGKVIECALRDDMAISFDVEAFNSLMKPVIIAISSCRVTTYHDLQLSATPATHYYFNPDIPEVEYSFDQYKAIYDTNPPLTIRRQRYDDREKEKMRNRFPLATLLTQNPEAYKSVRFTCKGTVIDLSATREWYHYTCTSSTCKNKLRGTVTTFECCNHGPQPEPNNRYAFKGIVSDGSAEALFTFFSRAADTLIKIECKKLVNQLENPYKLPPAIESIKGQEHIFQFHFNPSHRKDVIEFILDDILDDNITVEKYESEQPAEKYASEQLAQSSTTTKRSLLDESGKSETTKRRLAESSDQSQT